MKHVHFVRGRYVVRVTVPPDLRGVVGKRELVEPLGGDKKLAERSRKRGRAHRLNSLSGLCATPPDAATHIKRKQFEI